MEARAALLHDFGNAEAVADLDEFATRNNDFAAAGERRESDQYCGGAIVDDDGGFRAGEAFDEAREMNVAFATSAGGEIVFEIGISHGGALEFGDNGGGEGGAAEIGMKDDAGGVDDRAEGRGEFVFDGRKDALFDGFGGNGGFGGELAGEDGAADLGQNFANRGHRVVAVDGFAEIGDGRAKEELIDGG